MPRSSARSQFVVEVARAGVSRPKRVEKGHRDVGDDDDDDDECNRRGSDDSLLLSRVPRDPRAKARRYVISRGEQRSANADALVEDALTEEPCVSK